MQASAVEFETQGSIGIIRINRPDAGNTINEAAIDGLEKIINRLDSETNIVALIVTGAGTNTFSAGGDFKYFVTLDTRDEGLRMSRRMQAVLDHLWRGPQAVIAAINGKALGGGCELLTACHFRIASREAKFTFVQAANGITTGWGGGARLFHLVGRSEALRLLLTADSIDAAEALRIGLVNQVVKPEDVMPTAIEFAKRICKNSPASIRAFLELARLIYEGDLGGAVKYETEIFADRWTTDEFRQVMNDFHLARLARDDG